MGFKHIALSIILSLSIYANTQAQNSIVKIFTTNAKANYKYPWQTPEIGELIGSGAVIDGNRILTSAHVVSGAKYIEVLKENDPKKYFATVKDISYQADLALLEIKDESFFKGTKPLVLNPQVHHRDEVTVLGYPIGGNTISTTNGVISRIEYAQFSLSGEKLLAVQIDAAINPGNSGGPAINNKGELVGIAMQGIRQADNIGYIVPSIIISTFLDDVKDGKVDGFQHNSTTIRTMDNESMKRYYGLKNGNGILVTFADMDDAEIKKDDVIMAIDGNPIANNGTIVSPLGRVDFQLALHTKQVGSNVKLSIIRDKKMIEVPYTLKYSDKLIKKEFSEDPSYVIIGGLVFAPLTDNYLKALGYNSAGIDMLFYEQSKNKERTEPVVWLQTIFPHDVNRGYSSNAETVDKLNGVKVKNFKEFVSILDNSKDEFINIEMIEKTKVILNREEAEKSFQHFKTIYGLTADRNVD